MKYYYEQNKPQNGNAKLLKVERNKLNPLPGLSFVSIAYYRDRSGEVYAVIF